jgi:hypothetical protein
MSLIQEISAEPDFLYVRTKGEFSLEEAQENFMAMLQAVAQHKVKKVLMDGRGITGEPETMERFFYGEFTAESVAKFKKHGVALSTQFAYVLEEPVLDPNRFGETVAVNRGLVMKVFDALEDAREWLQIAPAKNPDVSTGTPPRRSAG